MNSIVEIIEFLKGLPKRMEGFDENGALVVLNTHQLAKEIDEAYHSVVEYAVIRTNKYRDSWVDGIFAKEADAKTHLKLNAHTYKSAGHDARIIKNIKGRRIWSEYI